MPKATHASDRTQLDNLQQIINIGPAIAEDLERIGISQPPQLIGVDPVELYNRLCDHDNQVYDRCVLDCFMSAVDFMNGNPPRKWWDYTEQRKKMLRDDPTIVRARST